MSNSGPIERFRAMARMRQFEQACLKGAQSGEIHGELHLGIGQEAVAAGLVGHLEAGDAVVSTHRNHCHGIAKGVDLRGLLAEIFEKEMGLCRGRGGHMHPFDLDTNFSATGIVGSSLPVALGYAYAFWMEDKPNIAIGVIGEGGGNAGSFHECLNIAGAWKLPFVVLVENNQYAISVRHQDVSSSETIAERGAIYGAWTGLVDGTDVEAVSSAFAEAADYARSRNGPAILEASCWRFRGHYEGDHDSYRDRQERRRMREKMDPLLLAKKRFIEEGLADEDGLDDILREAKREIDQILAEVRAAPYPDPAGVLDYVFVQD